MKLLCQWEKNYAFDVGNNVGGAGVHWNGMSYRFLPYDFQIKSLTEEKYGKNKVSKEYTIQDWGVNYDEMEPYYDKAEKMMGFLEKIKVLSQEKEAILILIHLWKKLLYLKNLEKRLKTWISSMYGSCFKLISNLYKSR